MHTDRERRGGEEEGRERKRQWIRFIRRAQWAWRHSNIKHPKLSTHMWACVHIHVWAQHPHTNTGTQSYTQTCTQTQTHTGAHTNACKHTDIQIDSYIHTYIYTNTHILRHTHGHKHLQELTHVPNTEENDPLILSYEDNLKQPEGVLTSVKVSLPLAIYEHRHRDLALFTCRNDPLI